MEWMHECFARLDGRTVEAMVLLAFLLGTNLPMISWKVTYRDEMKVDILGVSFIMHRRWQI